jgi:hypothetical protein
MFIMTPVMNAQWRATLVAQAVEGPTQCNADCPTPARRTDGLDAGISTIKTTTSLSAFSTAQAGVADHAGFIHRPGLRC